MTTVQPTEISVTFSNAAFGDVVHTFVLIRTTAPRQYDTFGTITRYEHADKDSYFRFVLMPKPHAEYFMAKARSGLYVAEYDDTETDSELGQWLFTNMVRGM